MSKRIGGTFLAALSAVLAAGSSWALPAPGDEWYEIRSPHFTLYAEGGERGLRKTLADLERFRTVLDRATGLELEPARPTYLFVFSRTRDYGTYTDPSGKVVTAGFFQQAPDGNYLSIDGANLEAAMGTVYHEYVHSVLEATFRSVPAWLNEGLAEFYSTYRCSGNDVETGRPVERHVRWLVRAPLMPLAQLFAVTPDSPEYNEQDKAGIFYAESWALVHMLLRGEQPLRSRSGVFVAAVLEGATPEEATRKAFGIELDALEAKLRTYLKQTEFTYTVTSFDDLPATQVGEARKLDRAVYLTRLGDLLSAIQHEKSEAAAEHYRAALALDSANARATAGLARLRFEEGKRDEARTLYETAVAGAPEDPTVLFYAGYDALSAFRSEAGEFTGSDANTAEIVRARTLLERAAVASPSNGEALALAGMTYLLAPGDAARGITLLEAASARLPNRADVLQNLMGLYARRGDRPNAEKTLARLLPLGSPEEIARAREMLLDLDLQAAEDAVGKKDYARALDLFRSVEGATTDEPLKVRIRERIVRLEAVVAEKRDRDAYRAIEPLYNQGKWGVVRKALQELLKTCTTEEVCKAARKELASLPK